MCTRLWLLKYVACWVNRHLCLRRRGVVHYLLGHANVLREPGNETWSSRFSAYTLLSHCLNSVNSANDGYLMCV